MIFVQRNKPQCQIFFFLRLQLILFNDENCIILERKLKYEILYTQCLYMNVGS
jgi:hypothetical protein